MRILHIQTMNSGGAAAAAHRLHFGLKSIGIKSKQLVLHRYLSNNDVTQLTQNDKIIRRLQNRLLIKSVKAELGAYRNTRPEGMDSFSDDRSIYDISKHPLVGEVDIINLHWVAGFINYTEFFSKITNSPKVIWTLHDENPFTGGCHVVGECEKYKTGCGSCPQLGSNDPNDLSRRIFKRKEEAYKGSKIYIITPSKWLADCAKRSLLFKNFPIDVIPNGVSTDIFKKRDRQFSRDLLNLPRDKTLILFGAGYKVERKGFRYLLEALKLLKERIESSKIALVTFGHKQDLGIFSKDTTFPVYQLGYIRDEALLSSVYSSCDMCIMTSLHENLPNIILESFSCGTPVIGVYSGGIPDMIIPHKTGLLAEAKNAEELAQQIKWMIEHPRECRDMGEDARKLVEEEYTPQVQAKSYVELYKMMLEN